MPSSEALLAAYDQRLRDERETAGAGICRALTAARAKAAVRQGYRCISSDSTEESRPILERSGFVKVSMTAPYEWRRSAVTGG